jgi:2-phospho-L-lactate guanylyltransferase
MPTNVHGLHARRSRSSKRSDSGNVRLVPSAAVLPIKRFERAKQRLNNELGVDARSTLAEAMLSDVLDALAQANSLEAVFVVSAEPTLGYLAERNGVVLIRDLVEAGQSRAALEGLARAAEHGYESVLLVPGDCPLVDPAELDGLLVGAEADGTEATIVPDRHRKGTNALLLHPASPLEPQFGPGSFARHVEQAERRGLRYAVESVPSLALDIDTNDDLDELGAELERQPGRASHTREVIGLIKGPHRRPVPA